MNRTSLRTTAFALVSSLAFATGCMAGVDANGEGPEDKTPIARGTFNVVLAKDSTSYMLTRDDGTYASLNLDHLAPSAADSGEAVDWHTASGSPVDVFGAANPDGSIDVRELAPRSDLVESHSALVATGTRRVLALRVGFDGGPTIATEQQVKDNLKEAADYFAGASFGKMKLEYDVAGPFNVKFGKCEDLVRWMNDAKTAAKAKGVDLARYQHFQIYAPIDCGYLGLGSIGGDMTFITILDWGATAIHELGHNLQLLHAASRTCTSNGKDVAMSDDCTYYEYGDPFDPMGSGAGHHYNANYKASVGWIAPSQIVTAHGDQTLTLAPMTAPSTGTQLIRVQGPKDVVYQVEFRQPAATENFSADDPAVHGVLVHAFFTQAKDAGRAYLLDMVPGGDFFDAALPAGKSYTFFGTKTTMTVLSTSPDGAKLKITGASAGGDGDTGESLVADHSRKCMSVAAASTASRALIVQRPCVGAKEESWIFTKVAADTFTIKNVNSGLCLDVPGASTASAVRVQQFACNGSKAQEWQFIDDGAGSASLRSVASDLCLDVSGASTADGAYFQQYRCHTASNQHFRRQ